MDCTVNSADVHANQLPDYFSTCSRKQINSVNTEITDVSANRDEVGNGLFIQHDNLVAANTIPAMKYNSNASAMGLGVENA